MFFWVWAAPSLGRSPRYVGLKLNSKTPFSHQHPRPRPRADGSVLTGDDDGLVEEGDAREAIGGRAFAHDGLEQGDVVEARTLGRAKATNLKGFKCIEIEMIAEKN